MARSSNNTTSSIRGKNDSNTNSGRKTPTKKTTPNKSPKRKSTPSSTSKKQRIVREEKQISKSPAEFFAENQSIAGFDNPGKSLYTTLRELVENSLDACESVGTLPDISLTIEEMTQDQFNRVRGVVGNSPSKSSSSKGHVGALFDKSEAVAAAAVGGSGKCDDGMSKSKDKEMKAKGDGNGEEKGDDNNSDVIMIENGDGCSKEETKDVTSTKENSTTITSTNTKGDDDITTPSVKKKDPPPPPMTPPPTTPSTNDSSKKKATKRGKKQSTEAYFRVTVRDNGCGMAHDAIPNLLGRVLSGSKYGVRQTRGKFGLGAKMALIWSKKSTGVPIKIVTSHIDIKKNNKKQQRNDNDDPILHGPFVSTCILDIDIYKNEPRVLEHTRTPNTNRWVGTQFTVLISGNWTTYKARIVQYLQQLAIITPYAKLAMQYVNLSDEKRNVTIRYDRRSVQMPPPAREVKHHPSSVNNLLISQLLRETNGATLLDFLTRDLSNITPPLARRLIACLSSSLTESTPPSSLTDAQIAHLVQTLRSSPLIKPPDASCLSPLGEYNLNLGIRKVILPSIVATARDRPGSYDGHPFLVEAAVSLGGANAREGISVARFANRIPLLFEGGADVVTRVAHSKIKWSSYKMDHKRDRIGVFVSIVSTKVPFKGTGKEYIGDDLTEISVSVKRALQSCCQQLRAYLSKTMALRDLKERRGRIVKYVPDVTRSIMGILDEMKKRRLEEGGEEGTRRKRIRSPQSQRDDESPRKAPLLSSSTEREWKLIKDKIRKEITEKTIEEHLIAAIESSQNNKDGDNNNDGDNDAATSGNGVATNDGSNAAAGGGRRGRTNGSSRGMVMPVYLVPVFETGRGEGVETDEEEKVTVVEHPLFTFRPLTSSSLVKMIATTATTAAAATSATEE